MLTILGHQPPLQRTDTTLNGYIPPAVRSHRLRETFFSMRNAVWNSLPASVIGSDSLFSNLD